MYYNPLDRFYKSNIGAVCSGEKTTFRVDGDFDSVVFVYRKDCSKELHRIPLIKNQGFFECDVALNEGLYFYRFDTNRGKIGLNGDFLTELSCDSEWFQLTVYSSDFVVPDWLSGGVIYQIFPDRFYASNREKSVSPEKILRDDWGGMPVFEPDNLGIVKNNDFFGGDLRGIIEKLDYLKYLGVSAIYLNPIFKAYSNHRYDTGDYMSIDPLLGDENDFIELVKEAESIGIKIILDGVFNHTGSDSVYFNKDGRYKSIGAYQSKDSPYYSWFDFIEYPNDYQSWWGIKTLPAVNKSNADYINFITGKNGVLEHYTKLGIGGWRLDVVDELPGDFVKKIRSAVKGVNKNAFIIGEVWEDASNKIAYGTRREYFQGKELDSVMNYPLKNAIIDFVRNGKVNSLSKTVKEQIDHYPKKVLDSLMNILSTHDTYRLITAICGVEMTGKSKYEMSNTYIAEQDMNFAKAKVKLASLLQFTLCGVPCVYYGDEIGMQGYVDPLNRKCFDWDNIDDELIEWYKFLSCLRKEYSALKNGDFSEIYAEDSAYVFTRSDENSELLIAINTGNSEYELAFNGKLYDLISKKHFAEHFLLSPLSCAVLIKKLN